MVYTIHKAKSQFSKLLREAESGKEVLIVRGRGGRPAFRIVPVLGTGAESRLQPKASLKRGGRVPGAAILARPLPPEEWGDLAG